MWFQIMKLYSSYSSSFKLLVNGIAPLLKVHPQIFVRRRESATNFEFLFVSIFCSLSSMRMVSDNKNVIETLQCEIFGSIGFFATRVKVIINQFDRGVEGNRQTSNIRKRGVYNRNLAVSLFDRIELQTICYKTIEIESIDVGDICIPST